MSVWVCEFHQLNQSFISINYVSSFRFQLPNLLKNHCYSVHREKKAIVTCEICGKSFSVKANFDKHMLSHTDKSERLAQLKQCEHCGEWLMTKSGIYYHEQIHTSGVQKCTQCEMELPHKIALLAHIRKYHRERNHKCSYCDKSFPVSSELKVIFLLFVWPVIRFHDFVIWFCNFPIYRNTKKATPGIMCIHVSSVKKSSH